MKKSTLATWCRDVVLTQEQIDALKARMPTQAGIPKNTNWKRRQEIKRIRAAAISRVPELINHPLWVAGVVLYWAEGTKGRNRICVANADPRALRLFIRWARQYLAPEAGFTLHLHLHEGNDDAAAKEYWARETGLSDARFIKPAGTGHRKNHLPHGVCTVRLLKASDAWNTTMAWIDELAARFGDARSPG